MIPLFGKDLLQMVIKQQFLSSGGYELKGFETGNQFSGAGIYVAWYPGRTDQTVDTTLQTSVGS